MTRMNDLPAARSALEKIEEGPVLAAVSGGLDSMCLLHLLTAWGRERSITVTAAHFNHQLRGPESDRDERFVRDWCGAHGVPFVSGRGDVRGLAAQGGQSIEEAAREARYAFLTKEKERLGCRYVLTAHHADDNAETMLLNLLRGTGLRGLTGIPAARGFLLRPFLQVAREELAAYAAAHSIPYVEDSTNALDDAARNVLRHQVLPVLKRLNPQAVEHMSRTAALLAEDEAALAADCGRLLQGCAIVPSVSAEVPVSVLEAAPAAIRSRAVLAVLAAVGGHEKDLTAAHVQAVLDLRHGQLSLPYGVTVRREIDVLRFEKTQAIPETRAVSLGDTVVFGPWQVTLTAEPGREGVALSIPAGAVLTITPWDPKDRLNGRTVKRLCVDRGMSLADREALPVLRVNGRAAAVPGLGLDENFALDRHETGARVIFYKDRGEQQ